MGRVISSVTITNANDRDQSIRCDALVDTGASMMVLPSAWRNRLGELETVRTVDLETANQSIIQGSVTGPVLIQLEGFDPIFGEVLFIDMESRDGIYDPLIGYVVLESSQAAVDMVRHQLMHAKTMDLK